MSPYVYDNEYGGEGKYDYQNSPEVNNTQPQPEESNEYTNNDIRDSLDSDSSQSNDGGNDYYSGYGY